MAAAVAVWCGASNGGAVSISLSAVSSVSDRTHAACVACSCVSAGTTAVAAPALTAAAACAGTCSTCSAGTRPTTETTSGPAGATAGATGETEAAEDAAGLEIAAASGIYPNVVDITPQMLQLLRANPNTVKRFPGVAGGISLEMVSSCLSFPCTINIITGMGLTGGGFGNSSATFAPLLGTSCWIYYSNPLATGLNASFAVTLSQTRELISGVYEYTNDDGTLRFFRIKWACKSVVQSASLARRIDKIA
jgi:hypothetical protein